MNLNDKFSARGVAIWLVCAVFFMYEFMLRTVMGTFQSPIMCDLCLSNVEFSLLSSTAYVAIYSIMQIPVGLIVDRWGIRNSLLFGCILCTISSAGTAYVDSLFMALFHRVIMAVGSSFGFICLLISVYDWLPKKHRATMVGMSQFIGTLGPMIASGPLESMAEDGLIEWRSLFYNLSIIGIALSVLIYLVVKNNHEKAGNFRILKRPESVQDIFKIVFMKPQGIYIAVFSGLVYFSLEYLSENEGKIFLSLKGHSGTFSAYMITLGWFSYAIWCPLSGFLSDRLQRRRPFLIISAASATIGLSLLIYTSHQTTIILGAILLGIGAAGQSVAFALIAEQFKKSYLAASISLNNCLTMFFAAINAPLLGQIIEYSKIGTASASVENYLVAFTVLLILASTSLIFSIFLIKETYCKSNAEFTILKHN